MRYPFEYWTNKVATPERPVSFDIIEVSFNVVRDEDQRQALNNIGTNLHLDDEAVDLLIKAAGDVMRRSPELQAFMKRTNGRVK